MSAPFKLYLSDGLAVYYGHEIKTKLHKHHALEIAMAFEKPFLISSNKSEFKKSSFSIISAGIPHQFYGQDDLYIFIFFDTAFSYALQIEDKLKLNEYGILNYSESDINYIRTKFSDWVNTDGSADEKIHIAINCLIELLTCSVVKEKFIEQRINKAVKFIQASLNEELSMDSIAAKVFLSESRFAHLFKEQIGIPFRRYILWCRIQAAVKAIAEGQTFTEAACEAGFADVAHLSRTFTAMFGVNLSEVLK